MSILIKGMSKPKTCDDCIVPLSKCDYLQKRADDCPLIEIDLVRCKDCKHYDTESRTFPCCTDIFGAVRYMEADGFCSYGERRADCEDETDEEWYDWRDEQEYEDRWERRADE